MCVVVNGLCLLLDPADGSFAKSKQSKLEEGDAPGSLPSVTEETDLAGNIMRPASHSSKRVTNL